MFWLISICHNFQGSQMSQVTLISNKSDEWGTGIECTRSGFPVKIANNHIMQSAHLISLA